MSKPDPFLVTFKQQYDRALQRVGWTPRQRLVWAIRKVQEGQGGLTPGQVDDLCRDVGVFASGARGGGAFSDDSGEDIQRPSSDGAKAVLLALDQMLTSASKRELILVGKRTMNTVLTWYEPEQRYIARLDGEGTTWVYNAREKLARLIEEFGHLIRVCPAPSPWKKEATCSTLFLAARPSQAFCSPRCQARAATKRFRQEATKQKKTARTSRSQKRKG